MNQAVNSSLGDLRAITHALCENDSIKKQIMNDLRAIRSLEPSKDCVSDVALIEQATARELLSLQLHYCQNEDTKQRVENYLQVLRYIEPAEATPKDADPTSPIKDATPKEIHNVMLSLCEDEDAKKRVVSHLRILRRSKTGGAATAGADPAALFDSATEMELRAIGIAMSDADQDMRKRLLESLRVLSVFGELHDTEIKNATFKCQTCKDFVSKGDNTPCTYHPGQVEAGMVPGVDLPVPVDRWSCCFRTPINRGCKTQRHHRQ